MKNKDLPAMPIPLNDGQSFSHHGEADGLTKREYFAAHAPDMPPHWLKSKGLDAKAHERAVAEYEIDDFYEIQRHVRAIVAWRWHYADMMLEGE